MLDFLNAPGFKPDGCSGTDWPSMVCFTALETRNERGNQIDNERSASLSVVGIFAGIDPVAIDIYGLSELMNLRGIALMADVAVYLTHLQGSQHTLCARLQ